MAGKWDEDGCWMMRPEPEVRRLRGRHLLTWLGVAADAARKVLSGRYSGGGEMMMKRISHISINKFKCRAEAQRNLRKFRWHPTDAA